MEEAIQVFLAKIVLRFLGPPLIIGDPGINVLSYFKIPKGKGHIFTQVPIIGDTQTVRPVTPSITALIDDLEVFEEGRYSSSQRRTIIKCGLDLDLWRKADLPDAQEYLAAIEEIESAGEIIPREIESLGDSVSYLLKALRDTPEIRTATMRSFQRNSNSKYLSRARINIETNPIGCFEGLLR